MNPPVSLSKAVIAPARSLPHKRPFVLAGALWFVHGLGVIATVTCTVVAVKHPGGLTFQALLVSLAFSAASWWLAWFKRSDAFCPLCKGTPLMNTGARPHRKAVRLRPLNEGVTATLAVILRQRFRCMYCGNVFDLLKAPGMRHTGSPSADQESRS